MTTQPHPPQNPGPGLEDPRTIHPAPEVPSPIPAESTAEADPEATESATPAEDADPAEDTTGMVDPRRSTPGPDL